MYVFGDPNTTGLFGLSGNLLEQNYKHRHEETFSNSRNNWNQLFFTDSDVKPCYSAHCCSGWAGLTLHLAFKLLSCRCIMANKSFFFPTLFFTVTFSHIFKFTACTHVFPVFILIKVPYLTKTMSLTGITNTSNYFSELFIHNAWI